MIFFSHIEKYFIEKQKVIYYEIYYRMMVVQEVV
jgi:threonine synthase